MHDTIFSLVTFGRGGWNWKDVYNLPVYLRNYYVKKMVEVVEKETAAVNGESSNEKTITGPGGLEYKRR